MSEDTLRTHPGSVLAAARAERKLTQRDVADVLNLSVAVVEAIETGDQQHLPASVFTMGYIRAYAKLLDLDPEPLLTDLSGPEPEEPQAKSQNSIKPIPVQVSPAVLGGGAVIVILLLVWVLWPSSQTPATNEQAEIDQIQEVLDDSAANPVESAPDLEALQSATMQSATMLNEESGIEGELRVAALIDDVPTEEESAAIADITSEVVSSLREGYLPLTNPGVQLLDIDFTEECWVEIKNSEGATLFADLGRPGRTFRFQGEGPFHVLLGYAPGAYIQFNEEPVVLSPHTRNNVASVVLGQ